jgi:hypothetical protein
MEQVNSNHELFFNGGRDEEAQALKMIFITLHMQMHYTHMEKQLFGGSSFSIIITETFFFFFSKRHRDQHISFF